MAFGEQWTEGRGHHNLLRPTKFFLVSSFLLHSRFWVFFLNHFLKNYDNMMFGILICFITEEDLTGYDSENDPMYNSLSWWKEDGLDNFNWNEEEDIEYGEEDEEEEDSEKNKVDKGQSSHDKADEKGKSKVEDNEIEEEPHITAAVRAFEQLGFTRDDLINIPRKSQNKKGKSA